MLKEKQLSGYFVSDVRHIRTPFPVTIRAEDSICSILQVEISEKHCRNIYVVDANETLLGVIRIKDVLRSLFPLTSLSEGISDGLNSLPRLNADTAEKLMTKPALCVTESTPLNQAALILIKENLFELPVVDAQNRIIGQVDASEIIAFSMKFNK